MCDSFWHKCILVLSWTTPFFMLTGEAPYICRHLPWDSLDLSGEPNFSYLLLLSYDSYILCELLYLSNTPSCGSISSLTDSMATQIAQSGTSDTLGVHERNLDFCYGSIPRHQGYLIHDSLEPVAPPCGGLFSSPEVSQSAQRNDLRVKAFTWYILISFASLNGVLLSESGLGTWSVII